MVSDIFTEHVMKSDVTVVTRDKYVLSGAQAKSSLRILAQI